MNLRGGEGERGGRGRGRKGGEEREEERGGRVKDCPINGSVALPFHYVLKQIHHCLVIDISSGGYFVQLQILLDNLWTG